MSKPAQRHQRVMLGRKSAHAADGLAVPARAATPAARCRAADGIH